MWWDLNTHYFIFCQMIYFSYHTSWNQTNVAFHISLQTTNAHIGFFCFMFLNIINISMHMIYPCTFYLFFTLHHHHHQQQQQLNTCISCLFQFLVSCFMKHVSYDVNTQEVMYLLRFLLCVFHHQTDGKMVNIHICACFPLHFFTLHAHMCFPLHFHQGITGHSRLIPPIGGANKAPPFSKSHSAIPLVFKKKEKRNNRIIYVFPSFIYICLYVMWYEMEKMEVKKTKTHDGVLVWCSHFLSHIYHIEPYTHIWWGYIYICCIFVHMFVVGKDGKLWQNAFRFLARNIWHIYQKILYIHILYLIWLYMMYIYIWTYWYVEHIYFA